MSGNTEKIRNEDFQLVQKARDGNFNAFEKLVDRYEGKVFGLAYKITRSPEDAEDVVQETFLSVLKNLRKFRAESSFYTWLIRIAANNALKVLRKRRRVRMVSIDEPGRDSKNQPFLPPKKIMDWKYPADVIAGKKETRAILNRSLEDLDEKYRLVFILRDIEGLSTKETAEILDISESNVKVRLMRARLMLRNILTEFFGDEKTAVESFRHEH